MTSPFTHFTLGALPEATPQEVLAATEALLTEAAARGEATLVTLDAHAAKGWHPWLGPFSLAARRPEAPPHLPAWLASLSEAPHVHAGGDTLEDAVTALIGLFREASERA